MSCSYKNTALIRLIALSLAPFTLPLLANEHAPELDFGLRTRWETAEVGDKKAHALTAKLRLSAKYKVFDQIDALVQADHVLSLNDDKYSDGVNQNSHPIIADPAGTEINQANLKADWFDATITLGRQRIVYDDQRFIGDVGFRQNDQTYDALHFEQNVLSGSKLSVAYIHNVNRIFGDEADGSLAPSDTRYAALNGVRPSAQLGNHHVDGTLLHLDLNEWDHIELSAYGYAVHNYDVSAFSNRTFGLESQYRHKLGDIKTLAAAEFALQQQQAKDIQWLAYRKISASLEYLNVEFGLRHELLAERDGVGFTTPLATLHKFQGWADQFLNTPNEGLVDNSVNLKWSSRPWTVDARHHWFESDKGSIDIGQEFDLDLIFSPKREHEVKLRFADFNPDSGQTLKVDHVRKLFLMYSYNL